MKERAAMDAPDSSGRFPFTSFPDGWFFFELSRNMPAGKLVGRAMDGAAGGRLARRRRTDLRRGRGLSPPGCALEPRDGRGDRRWQTGVSVPWIQPMTYPERAYRPRTRRRRRRAGSSCIRPKKSTVSCSPRYDKAEREPRWWLPVMDEAGWTPTARAARGAIGMDSETDSRRRVMVES